MASVASESGSVVPLIVDSDEAVGELTPSDLILMEAGARGVTNPDDVKVTHADISMASDVLKMTAQIDSQIQSGDSLSTYKMLLYRQALQTRAQTRKAAMWKQIAVAFGTGFAVILTTCWLR